MTTADLVLVGAGPQGLAALSALAAGPAPWPERVVVVDPGPGWAHAWDAKLARLRLDRLRSPQVHHPGPRPMALRDLVEALPEPEQLALRRAEDERVPTPAGMRALLDELVAGLGPVRWLTGQAASVTLEGGEGTGSSPAAADDASGDQDGDDPTSGSTARVTVTLEDGRRITARAVILAHNPSLPRLPEWAAGLGDRLPVQHASDVDLGAELSLADPRQLAITGAGTSAEAPSQTRHVAIVGGGLTAGSLACEVVAHGWRATLLTRRPLRPRPYDVDARWLGPRELAAFGAAGQRERRALVDAARDGGTMPARVLEQVRALAEQPGSGLVLREAVDVEAELALLADEAISAQTPDVDGTRSGRPDDAGAATAYVAPPVDAVWLATGFENDVEHDPLAGPLVRSLGTRVHGGLPEVTEASGLAGAPVFVLGPYAALAVGPASRNLSGARPAAARVAAGVGELLAQPVGATTG